MDDPGQQVPSEVVGAQEVLGGGAPVEAEGVGGQRVDTGEQVRGDGRQGNGAEDQGGDDGGGPGAAKAPSRSGQAAGDGAQAGAGDLNGDEEGGWLVRGGHEDS